MKPDELKVISKFQNKFTAIIKKSFPQVTFGQNNLPGKFIGIIQVPGQKPIALFIKSHKPPLYTEVVL